MWQNPFQTQKEQQRKLEELAYDATKGERQILKAIYYDREGQFHIQEDGKITTTKHKIRNN